MTIKQLIQKLNKFDEKTEIMISTNKDGQEFTQLNDIKKHWCFSSDYGKSKDDNATEDCVILTTNEEYSGLIYTFN